MPLPLHILHLEDDPLDSELAAESLRAEGLTVSICRVDNLPRFTELLADPSIAPVVSDYTVPGVSAIEALKLSREQRPEIPFIFLSGTIGEERATEALKLGATDYVLKQHLETLLPVSLGALVVEARRELAPMTEHRRIEWRIGELPEIDGDPPLLQSVVTNLLSNAVKYTSRRNVAIIEVQAEVKPDEIVSSVRDNGAGFNMSGAKRLFGVFQRLHSPEEFEGTGIGLASVRRIIHRHGGRVWATAKEGAGATFYFALPRRNNGSRR